MKKGDTLILKSGVMVRFLEYSKKEKTIWVQAFEDNFGRKYDESGFIHIDRIAEIAI